MGLKLSLEIFISMIVICGLNYFSERPSPARQPTGCWWNWSPKPLLGFGLCLGLGLNLAKRKRNWVKVNYSIDSPLLNFFTEFSSYNSEGNFPVN